MTDNLANHSAIMNGNQSSMMNGNQSALMNSNQSSMMMQNNQSVNHQLHHHQISSTNSFNSNIAINEVKNGDLMCFLCGRYYADLVNHQASCVMEHNSVIDSMEWNV